MPRLALRLGLTAMLAAPSAWLACSSFDGDAPATVDAAPPDDVAPPPDDVFDAGPGITDFADHANWKTFDLDSLAPATFGWLGSAFDGTFVYFSPLASTVIRYDTTKAFDDPASWQKYEVAAFGTTGALGAIVTPDWIYFLPNFNATPYGRVAYRYRRSGMFTDSTSWESLSFDQLGDGGVAALGGAVFDGERIVGVPFYKQAPNKPGLLVSFSASETFTQPAAWKLDSIPASYGIPPDLTGAALVNGYIYSASLFTPRLVRVPPNLATKDVVTLPYDPGDGGATGAFGSISDGQYVYLPPFIVGGKLSGIFVRYDTKAAYSLPASYETFDLRARDPELTSFTGGTWDGRFVYFTPFQSGKFVRYDTTKKFEAGTLDVFDSIPDYGVQNRSSATFDGQYVYFPSASKKEILRFRARDTRTPDWPVSTSTF